VCWCWCCLIDVVEKNRWMGLVVVLPACWCWGEGNRTRRAGRGRRRRREETGRPPPGRAGQASRQGVTESAVSSAPSSLRKAVPSHGLRDRRYSSSIYVWAS
jgi:hypothetical protein